MTELTEQDNQHILDFRTWLKTHPELNEVLKEQKSARYLMLKARFNTFNLPYATLSKIVEYGNEEFLMGYYLASHSKGGDKK